MIFGPIGDFLFGESPKAKTTRTSRLLPEQENRLRDLIAALGVPDLSLSGFPGRLSAPLSNLERTSLAALEKEALDLASGGAAQQTAESTLSDLLKGRTGREETLGLSDTTLQALLKGESVGGTAAGDTALNRLLSAEVGADPRLRELISGEPTGFEEFFEQSIQRPLLRTFEEDILPSISARSGGSFFSSGRERLDERALQNLTEQLASARSELGFRTRESAADRSLNALRLLEDITSGVEGRRLGAAGLSESARDRALRGQLGAAGLTEEFRGDVEQRRLQSLGFLDSVTSLPINQAIKLAEAGQIPREVQQAGLTAEYLEFLRQQEARSNRVTQLIQVLGVSPFDIQTVVQGGQTGIIPAFVGSQGGSTAIAGVLGKIFSSRDFKEDIEEIDEEDVLEGLTELPIARWKYIGDDVEHIGPMAEDFQETFGVGDGKTIHLADVSGVLLASNKALAKRLEALRE